MWCLLKIALMQLLACILCGMAYGSEYTGTLHRRTYFHVGGSYVETSSSISGPPSYLTHGQMYVEHLVPATVNQSLPLVFVHGNGMTGSNFLNTPDGRLGWADYFMSIGYEVYLVDQPARGRSAWQPTVDGNLSAFNNVQIEQLMTATQLSDLWPQAFLHTQWPGNGTKGDPTFDLFYKSIMQYLSNEVEASKKVLAAGTALLDKIGPCILVTHSQSGAHGWLLADAKPDTVNAIVALEPIGPPFVNAIRSSGPARPYGLTELPLSFTPPISSPVDLNAVAVYNDPTANFTCFQQGTDPPRQLTNLLDISVIVVTSEAGYHAVYDSCTVQFLAEAGVHVDHVQLEDVGIRGNGHMMFMEKNNIQIAELVQTWLSRRASVCPVANSHLHRHWRLFDIE